MALVLILSVIDIIGNRLFKFPLPGGYDIIGLLAVPTITFAIAQVQKERGHIEVEILEERLRPLARKIVNTVVNILGIFLWSVITWRSFDYGIYIINSGQVSMTISAPLFPFIFIMGFCSALVVMVLIVQSVNNFKMVSK